MSTRSIASLTSLALLVSCKTSERPGVSPGARDIFKTRCAPCHGDTGRGDGLAVAKLPTKPPDFSDATWQRSVGDDELRKAIVFGGPAVGKGSAMPAVHDLEGKPELDELVALVRSFKAE